MAITHNQMILVDSKNKIFQDSNDSKTSQECNLRVDFYLRWTDDNYLTSTDDEVAVGYICHLLPLHSLCYDLIRCSSGKG